MSMTLNYELIYKLRRHNIRSRQQIETAHRIKAMEAADAECAALERALSKAIGHDNYVVSDWGCMADGIANHVFTPKTAPEGVGHRTCVFCGCDDFTD